MSHLSGEELVAYFAGDHPDEARVEEHLFSCAACTREGERVAAVTEAMRAMINVVITRATVARLAARGLRIRESPASADVPNEAEFPADVDVLLHRLQGLDLTDASQVDVRVLVESSGHELSAVPAVPFDRDAGEILIACQRHFAAFPPDTLMEITVRSPRGDSQHRYPILHRYAF